ncbi:hypothetical protein M436DRAFT_84384 [Aureobasidium namibiae CBS 147.97]|uniref:Uncharacterized protein n=1 Tax=Aureobasidium namibiae CBS 147.97 TaxID=1043004 RepID=A0A074WCF5_9PEZI
MPPIRTAKCDTKSDVDSKKKRPSLANMFISVSRVKPYTATNWNSQIRISRCLLKPDVDAKHVELSSLVFSRLQKVIELDLTDVKIGLEEDDEEFDGITWCLVWRMSGSGQLGRVYDSDSFQSAVQDHRRGYKNIVQLYIIGSKDALWRSEF